MHVKNAKKLKTLMKLQLICHIDINRILDMEDSFSKILKLMLKLTVPPS